MISFWHELHTATSAPAPSKIPIAVSGAAKKSAVHWRSRAHRHPQSLAPSKAVDQHPGKSTLQPCVPWLTICSLVRCLYVYGCIIYGH